MPNSDLYLTGEGKDKATRSKPGQLTESANPPAGDTGTQSDDLRDTKLDLREKYLKRWESVLIILTSLYGAGFIGRRLEQSRSRKSWNSQRDKSIKDLGREVGNPAAGQAPESPQADSIGKAFERTASLLKQEKRDEAIDLLRSIAIIEKETDPKIAAIALTFVGVVLGDDKPREQVSAYDEAILLEPKNATLLFNRGNSKRVLGDREGAISDFNQAILLDPNNAAYYNNRGVERDTLGDREGAVCDFNQAIRLKPDDATHYNNRGGVKGNLGDHNEAVADFNQAILLDPNNAAYYDNLGKAKWILDDYKGAIAAFTEAIRLEPKNGAYFIRRSIVRGHLGQPEEGLADFKRGMCLGVDDDDAKSFFAELFCVRDNSADS